MSVPSTARSEQLSGIRLMRPGLAKMIAAIRLAIGVAAIASALLGMGRPLSWSWLIPSLAAVVIWTPIYAAVAWIRGLRPWLIGIDVLLMCILCLAIGKLVPPEAIPGSLNWVQNIASMVVIGTQLAGKPIVSVPAGLLVTASLVAGAQLAHSSDAGIPAGLVVGSQVVVAAMVMAVGMRAENAAVRAFANLEKEHEAATLATARRDEESDRLRMVHSGPLTTLAMAPHAATGHLNAVVRKRAAVARQDLLQLAIPAGDSEYEVRLDERLAQVVSWYQSRLKIAATLPECSVRTDIAEAFARATAEALENVVRHSGTEQAQVELRDRDGIVWLTVSDQGRGFETTQVSPFGFGLREDMTGRMSAIGGSAAIRSIPGAGTVVKLEWRRD